MRDYHDLGGLPARSIERVEHDYALWEKRIDALVVLLSNTNPPLFRDDELRRGIEPAQRSSRSLLRLTVESLGADAYERLSYYERWIAALTNVLLEKGVFTSEELELQMAEVANADARGYTQIKGRC